MSAPSASERELQYVMLLNKAWRELHQHNYGRSDDLRKEIEAAIPHPDPRFHARAWDGGTRCGMDLNRLPRPLCAEQDDKVNCVACLEAFLRERRARIDEGFAAIAKTQKQIQDCVGVLPMCKFVYPRREHVEDDDRLSSCRFYEGHPGGHAERGDAPAREEDQDRWYAIKVCPYCERWGRA